MSRYLILILLNLPLIIAGVTGALVDYKMGKLSKRKFILITAVWLVILAGLISAESIYNYLASNNLTQTPSMSLFDVIQFTGIVYILFIANRSRIKADALERRLNDLHQEVSIILSEDSKKKSK